MADLDERLNQLISDQENMNKVLEMAKAILAQRDSASPESATAQTTPPPQPSTAASPDLASVLASMLADSAAEPDMSQQAEATASPSTPQGLNALAAVLPQLLQVMSGEGNLVKSERVNLLKAMRPYLREQRWNSIDRALKMANVAKAATSAIHLLGR